MKMRILKWLKGLIKKKPSSPVVRLITDSPTPFISLNVLRLGFERYRTERSITKDDIHAKNIAGREWLKDHDLRDIHKEIDQLSDVYGLFLSEAQSYVDFHGIVNRIQSIVRMASIVRSARYDVKGQNIPAMDYLEMNPEALLAYFVAGDPWLRKQYASLTSKNNPAAYKPSKFSAVLSLILEDQPAKVTYALKTIQLLEDSAKTGRK